VSKALQSKGEFVVMIAREWKCQVPEAHSDGFTGYLYDTGIKDSSGTSGYLGAQILRRSLNGKIELTLITYWESLESIKAFAGDDISQARLYPEDEVYELEPDLSVQHYEVIEHQFSAEARG
jgi:heme-degrading monooxygenase HmoA